MYSFCKLSNLLLFEENISIYFYRENMFDLKLLQREISELQTDVPKNYEKLLNIYLTLLIEYLYLKKTQDF